MARYKFCGCDDRADYCTCCGKQDLKMVVWLMEEGGIPEPYGVVCAARILGYSRPSDKETKARVLSEKKAAILEAQKQIEQAREALIQARAKDAVVDESSYVWGMNKFGVTTLTAKVTGVEVQILSRTLDREEPQEITRLLKNAYIYR